MEPAPGTSSVTLRGTLPPKILNSAHHSLAEDVCRQRGSQGAVQLAATHWPPSHVDPWAQAQVPPQPLPPQVPGAQDGVQQAWFARHVEPAAQAQVPPQPLPPQVPGAQYGVQQVWFARHVEPAAQAQVPPQPLLPPQVP